MINGILGPVWQIVDPQTMVILPVLECINEIDIVSNWHNSLTHLVEAIMVRKNRGKP